MKQETKSNLVYALVAIGITLAIAGVAQVNADLAFGLIVTFMAFSVVWFVVHAIRTWSKTHILTKCMAVYGFVLMVYWCGYLQEYWSRVNCGGCIVMPSSVSIIFSEPESYKTFVLTTDTAKVDSD